MIGKKQKSDYYCKFRFFVFSCFFTLGQGPCRGAGKGGARTVRATATAVGPGRPSEVLGGAQNMRATAVAAVGHRAGETVGNSQ